MLALRARECRSGEILAEEQSEASGKKMSSMLSVRSLSVSAPAWEKHSQRSDRYSTPLAEATTSSLDALKDYSEGFRVLSSSGSAAALPFFKHAIEIDPGFAMAYAHLGIVYTSIGESELAFESIQRAYELQGRVSERREVLYLRFLSRAGDRKSGTCATGLRSLGTDVSRGDGAARFSLRRDLSRDRQVRQVRRTRP